MNNTGKIKSQNFHKIIDVTPFGIVGFCLEFFLAECDSIKVVGKSEIGA